MKLFGIFLLNIQKNIVSGAKKKIIRALPGIFLPSESVVENNQLLLFVITDVLNSKLVFFHLRSLTMLFHLMLLQLLQFENF